MSQANFFRALRACLALGSATTGAFAQTFLIDLGAIDDVPLQTYGAAAQASGYWYAQAGPFTFPQPLLDRFGEYTGASLFVATSPPVTNGEDAHTEGDDDALCDDGARCGLVGGSDIWEFAGLRNGVYHVFTYAFRPEAQDDQVLVSVAQSIDAPLLVGGPWPGAHVEGVTYARHRLFVTDGKLQVETSRLSEEGMIAGFQIVRIDDNVNFGTSYCPATTNSTGLPAHLWIYGTLDAATLRAEPLPEPGPALFFYGPLTQELSFGNGRLCVAGPLTRLRPLVFVQNHLAQLDVDLSQTGLSAIYIQCWYRDPAAGGAFFNLSDGLALP